MAPAELAVVSAVEIPLLRESVAFSARLRDATRRFAEPRYQHHRRVNWSYRYDRGFYAREAARFVEAPDAYLSGRLAPDMELADVYALRLSARQTVTTLLKVLAHLAFHALGRFADGAFRRRGIPIYRKCYVDDIELVFDPAEAGVVRAVYPFPINLARQLRYLRWLRRNGLRFKLDGNPYLLGDVVRFVARRDVRSLMRLESRAQIRQAAPNSSCPTSSTSAASTSRAGWRARRCGSSTARTASASIFRCTATRNSSS